jgi:hypothetical protein
MFHELMALSYLKVCVRVEKKLHKEEIFDAITQGSELSEGSLRVHINKLRKSDEFTKYLPTKFKNRYMQVFKSTDAFKEKLFYLKIKIIAIQLALLLIFAFISYKLAKSALKPF